MRRLALVLAVLVSAAPGLASAQVGLRLTQIDGSVRVDGMLREWRDVRLAELGEGPDASLRWALAYDDQALYVAAEVSDDRVVRTAQPGRDEDAVIVTLALPARRGLEAVDVWLYSGVSGRAASAALGPVDRAPRAIEGASVVEAPRTGGYTLEARIPWSAIPGADRWQEGRGSIRLRDVDQAAHPTVEAEPTVAAVDAAHLDRLPELLPTGGEHAELDAFLESRGLGGMRPVHDLRGDVGGDARPERVVLVDRYVVVMGPGWLEGRSYSFMQLAIDAAADLRSAELRDLTADGKAELVVVLRQRGGGGSRDLWQVLSFASGNAVTPMFGIEIRKEASGGHVESSVRVVAGRRGAAATIQVRAGEAHSLDASSLREAPPTDVEAMLLPWGPVLERHYRWDGQAFARVHERANPHYVDPEAAAAAARDREARTTSTSAQPEASAPTLDALLAAFRRERHIADRTRPAFDLRGNVAGDPDQERVVLYGRDLVVVGARFRDGTGWFHYELPAEVLDLRLVDITGEGRAEVVLRVRQSIAQAGGAEVRREILLVHHFTPEGFPMLLEREIAREQGTSRIENELSLSGGTLEIRPGTARGWSASSWPWSDGTSDGIEPLLLPWRDRAVRYRWAGGRLSAQ